MSIAHTRSQVSNVSNITSTGHAFRSILHGIGCMYPTTGAVGCHMQHKMTGLVRQLSHGHATQVRTNNRKALVTGQGRCQTRASCTPAQRASTSVQKLKADGPQQIASVRRQVLFGLATALCASGSSRAVASPEQGPVNTIQYPFTSEVRADMILSEYHRVITGARPATWQKIAKQIAAGQYNELADDLTTGSMGDIRKATLYIPWAALQNNDFSTAMETRKQYNELESHVMDLQMAAISAAETGGDPARVQQAFILMSASMDAFLAAIPPSYLNPGLPLLKPPAPLAAAFAPLQLQQQQPPAAAPVSPAPAAQPSN